MDVNRQRISAKWGVQGCRGAGGVRAGGRLPLVGKQVNSLVDISELSFASVNLLQTMFAGLRYSTAQKYSTSGTTRERFWEHIP